MMQEKRERIFAIGDVTQLEGGGPSLTVTAYKPRIEIKEGPHRGRVIDATVKVAWATEIGEIHEMEFPAAAMRQEQP